MNQKGHENITQSNLVDNYLSYMAANKNLFWPAIEKNFKNNKELFCELADPMLQWSKNYLGKGYEKILADGYAYFVIDVNKSQMEYERLGRYKNKTYEEVYKSAYSNEEHMAKYHWGVYVTTFAWEHHLKIYKFYTDYFLAKLNSLGGSVLELGSGSGIWGMLMMNKMQNWIVTGVDISQSSVHRAEEMSKYNGFDKRSKYIVADALTFNNYMEVDAVIACFLLEHLETPLMLLNNMARNLKVGGYAFLTCALTAAEVDHIYELRRESEIILLSEHAGFRIISCYSSAPESYPYDYKFLPRSFALVMQRRRNDIY